MSDPTGPLAGFSYTYASSRSRVGRRKTTIEGLFHDDRLEVRVVHRTLIGRDEMGEGEWAGELTGADVDAWRAVLADPPCHEPPAGQRGASTRILAVQRADGRTSCAVDTSRSLQDLVVALVKRVPLPEPERPFRPRGPVRPRPKPASDG